MKPQRRPGRPVRHMMADPRWRRLPLGARALWVEMSVLADARPELRHPGETVHMGLKVMAALMEIDPGEVLNMMGFLTQHGIARLLDPDIVLLEAF